MTNRLAHILLSLLAVALTIVSCISDREVCTDSSQSDDKVQVKFTIAMDNATTSTRGSWDSDIKANGEKGDYYENTIEMGKFQVLVYNSSDNKYIGKVNKTSYIRETGTSNNLYSVIGDLSIDKSDLNTDQTLDCFMVVLANYDNESSPTTDNTIADLQSTYSYDHDNIEKTYTATTTDTKKYIPIWGVKHVKVSLKAGSSTDIGEIYMLRAMAKVQLSLDAAFAASYTIVSAKLTDSNNQGYVVPTTGETFYSSTISTENYGTKQLDADNCFNVLAKTETTAIEANFWQEYEWNTNGTIGDKVANRYIIYVPEYKQGSTPATIKVTLRPSGETTADKDKEYEIELKKYDTNGNATGNALNLVRNSIYKYNITGIEGEKLNVTFAVAEWEQVTSQIGWDAQNGVEADFVFYAWPSKEKVYYTSEKKRSNKSDGNTTINNVIKSIHGDLKYDKNLWTGKYSGNGVYELGNAGDAEASVCLVNYPRYEDGEHTYLEFDATETNTSHGKSSAVSFYFRLRKPIGAVWEAYLVNDDATDPNFKFNTGSDNWKYYDADNTTTDFDWSQLEKVQEHVSVTTGIAREEPYSITISATHPWFNITNARGTSATEKVQSNDFEGGLTSYGTKWEANTSWTTTVDGKSIVTGGPHADLHIRISTDGEHWYDLAINPKGQTIKNLYYKDNRRFAVGEGDENDDDFHVRIWQLKARKDIMYDKMQSQNPETDDNFRKDAVGKGDDYRWDPYKGN